MHLHIDCSFGVSGDMLLAALADSGAEVSAIQKALEELSLEDFSITSEKTLRGGLAALHVDVKDHSQCSCGCHTHHHHDHDHEHKHDHDQHGHDHGTEHSHHHHDEKGNTHRHLADLLQLLDPEVLSERVRTRAERIFRIIAEAEATVHSVPIDRVHFHEISGIDTAVDVIGTCIALEMLNIDSISASVPAAGTGMIMCAHGLLPVPAPATLEILKSRNIPWRAEGDGERMTPTGAALLAGLVDSFGASPELTVTRIGYGAGSKDFTDAPNLLRVIIGKPAKDSRATRVFSPEPAEDAPASPAMPLDKQILFPPAIGGESEYLEVNKTLPERIVEFRLLVDDMTPESIAFLQELCLANGALEAYALPATMKKGRLGHEITVLSPTDLAAKIAELIWHNSSTFGIRIRETSRLTLPRESKTVTIDGHKIRVKIGWFGDKIIRRQPEYEDCRAASLASGKSLTEIFRLATQAALDIH